MEAPQVGPLSNVTAAELRHSGALPWPEQMVLSRRSLGQIPVSLLRIRMGFLCMVEYQAHGVFLIHAANHQVATEAVHD